MAFKRDWADVQRAKEKYLSLETKSEVTGLPPGFISGGELDIDDNRVRVAPFIAHVAGKRIQVDIFTTQNNMNEVVDIETGYYYHIYIDKEGQFYIDIVEPTVSERYYGYYHPAVEWRYLGSFLQKDSGPSRLISSDRSEIEDFIIGSLYDFNDDDKLTPGEKYQVKKEWDIIVSSHPAVLTQAAAAGVSDTTLVAKYTALNTYLNTTPGPLIDLTTTTTDIDGDTLRLRFSEYYQERENIYDSINALVTRPIIVTVGSSSYTGLADFKCDGTNDEVQIQAAIDFLDTTYGGGQIQLTYGTYNIENDIDRGVQASAIIIEGQGGNTVININGGDYIGSVNGADSIHNCRITITTPGASYRGLALGLGANSAIRACTIEDNYNTDDTNYMIVAGDRATISNCIFQGSAGVRISGDSSIISGCVFKDFKYNFAIWVSGDNVAVSNNTFESSDIGSRVLSEIPSGADQCIYITGSGCSVDGNTFRQAATNRHTIRVDGDNNIISGNNSIDSDEIFIYVDPDVNDNVISGNNAKNSNVLLTSGFESVTAPGFGGSATISNATFTRTTEWAYYGDYSFKMTQVSGASDSAVYFQDSISTTDMHNYQAGQSYNIEVALESGNDPSACSLVIDEYVGGSWVNLGTFDIIGAGSFILPVSLSSPVTISARATAVRAGLVIPAGNLNKYVYVDQLRIWQTSKDNFTMNHLRNFSETTQQIGNSWNGIDGQVQSYVDIDLASSSYVIDFDDILVSTAIYGATPTQTANIGYKFRVSWHGGDGTYNLSFSSTSTWNINNISESNYQGEGTGGLDFTVVADGELVATAAGGGEVWDNDGGNFGSGEDYFYKYINGKMEQHGVSTTTASMSLNTSGTISIYRATFTRSFIVDFGQTPIRMGAQIRVDAAANFGFTTAVQYTSVSNWKCGYHAIFDYSGSTRNVEWNAWGWWSTASPRIY